MKNCNMKHTALITLSTILLLSCGNNNQNNNSDSLDREMTTVEQNQGIGNYQGKHIVLFKNNSISFFGKTMVIDDSTHIMQQIKDVVAGDENLSIEGNVLTIGDVSFGINLSDDGVILISSTQVDEPKIKPVVKYLTAFTIRQRWMNLITFGGVQKDRMTLFAKKQYVCDRCTRKKEAR